MKNIEKSLNQSHELKEREAGKTRYLIKLTCVLITSRNFNFHIDQTKDISGIFLYKYHMSNKSAKRKL